VCVGGVNLLKMLGAVWVNLFARRGLGGGPEGECRQGMGSSLHRLGGGGGVRRLVEEVCGAASTPMVPMSVWQGTPNQLTGSSANRVRHCLDMTQSAGWGCLVQQGICGCNCVMRTHWQGRGQD
jgi:hypothetical protein